MAGELNDAKIRAVVEKLNAVGAELISITSYKSVRGICAKLHPFEVDVAYVIGGVPASRRKHVAPRKSFCSLCSCKSKPYRAAARMLTTLTLLPWVLLRVGEAKARCREKVLLQPALGLTVAFVYGDYGDGDTARSSAQITLRTAYMSSWPTQEGYLRALMYEICAEVGKYALVRRDDQSRFSTIYEIIGDRATRQAAVLRAALLP